MFGHSRRKRQRKHLKKEKAAFELEKQKFADENSASEKQRESDKKAETDKSVAESAQKSKENRTISKKEGQDEALALLNREDIPGLDPGKKQALQYEAHKGINRGMQSANRELLGDQSSRGIMGKGGVGYAQQKDLAKVGMEAQGQANRDLTKLDSDLALKKKAAIYAAGHGEAAQSQLDEQKALDDINLTDEKKRQKYYDDFYTNLFSRI